MALRTSIVGRALVCAAVACMAGRAQIVINEAICDPVAGNPGFNNPMLELWNQGQYPVDLTGWRMGIWAGDTGTLQTWVVPSAATNGGGERIVFGHCCFVIAQALAPSSAVFSEPTLPASVRGLRLGMGWPWTPTANLGVWFKVSTR